MEAGLAAGPPMATHARPMLVFRVGRDRCAIELGAVAEVVRAAATTTMPDAGSGELGYLNLRGISVRAVQLAAILGKRPRPMTLSDRFVILGSDTPWLAALVDHVEGVVEVASIDDRPLSVRRPRGRRQSIVSAGRPATGGDLLAIIDADRLRRLLVAA